MSKVFFYKVSVPFITIDITSLEAPFLQWEKELETFHSKKKNSIGHFFLVASYFFDFTISHNAPIWSDPDRNVICYFNTRIGCNILKTTSHKSKFGDKLWENKKQSFSFFFTVGFHLQAKKKPIPNRKYWFQNFKQNKTREFFEGYFFFYGRVNAHDSI